MADKAKGRIRAVRHLSGIVFQQYNAFGGDLLIQSDLILNQRLLCVKAGLAVFHIDAFGLCLAVIDASTLQAQNALHAAGIGRDQHIGRNHTARQCDTQHTRNGSLMILTIILLSFFFCAITVSSFSFGYTTRFIAVLRSASTPLLDVILSYKLQNEPFSAQSVILEAYFAEVSI